MKTLKAIAVVAAVAAVGMPPANALVSSAVEYTDTLARGEVYNVGLSNTAGGAFATIQKAVDVVYGTLNLGGYAVTIQIVDGTYTGGVIQSYPQVGAGDIIIQGNNSAPANVLVSTTSADAFKFQGGAIVTVKDLKITTTTSGNALYALTNGVIYFSNVNFGACAARHIRADDNGAITVAGNYTISGGAIAHLAPIAMGMVRVQAITITLSGTPAFTNGFVESLNLGILSAASNTFSGSATGPRYTISGNSVVFTGAAGSTYFPGNSAGSTASGGQYL